MIEEHFDLEKGYYKLNSIENDMVDKQWWFWTSHNCRAQRDKEDWGIMSFMTEFS